MDRCPCRCCWWWLLLTLLVAAADVRNACFCLLMGCRCLSCPALLPPSLCLSDSNAYAILELYEDRALLLGRGVATSRDLELRQQQQQAP